MPLLVRYPHIPSAACVCAICFADKFCLLVHSLTKVLDIKNNSMPILHHQVMLKDKIQ